MSENKQVRKAHWRVGASLALMAVACNGQAADLVNGWSAVTRITSVYSLWSTSMYKIAGTTDGCGHADYWQMAVTDTAASKLKHAQLLAAFTGGKQVSLRCENGNVTDFQIFE
jgi:hypothetical protein